MDEELTPFEAISDHECFVVSYGTDHMMEMSYVVVGTDRGAAEAAYAVISRQYPCAALEWRYNEYSLISWEPEGPMYGWSWEHSLVHCKGCDND
jgi:hypothetical protein